MSRIERDITILKGSRDVIRGILDRLETKYQDDWLNDLAAGLMDTLDNFIEYVDVTYNDPDEK